jgi:hypothetical protein
MVFNPDEQERLNRQHAENPAPGDFWHEMYCPCWVVLRVSDGSVTVCEKTRSTDDKHWTWDISVSLTMAKTEFTDRLRYNPAPMTDKYWCDVMPERDKVFADAWEASCA